MSPTTAHWNEAIRVLKYLKGTRDLALVLGGKSTELEGFVDADYGGDQNHRFSTTGFVLTVFGGAVVWGSKKQSDVATSTVQAEFMAASTVVKEANWLRGFLEEIGVLPWIVKTHCENQGCISHLKNPVFSKHTKHIALSFHFARLLWVRWTSSILSLLGTWLTSSQSHSLGKCSRGIVIPLVWPSSFEEKGKGKCWIY
jgi:hypothetical protein